MRLVRTILALLGAAILIACGGTRPSATSVVVAMSPTPTPIASQTPVSVSSSAAETPLTIPSPTGDSPGLFAYGFNAFARGDATGAAYNQQLIDTVKGASFGWVRIQIRWSSFEPQPGQWNPLPTDRIVQDFDGSGVKILATLVAAPDWAVDPTGQRFLKDDQDFAAFAHFVVERYGDKIGAWQMWNEENIASNMGGTVRVSDYAKLLRAGYQGAKQADPNAIVLFGSLTPTGVNDPSIAIDDVGYLKSFYDYQNGTYAKYFDLLGAHANATKNPPDEMYPDDPGTGDWSNDGSFYFRRVEQLHQVMSSHTDTRPVWITEFGWTTASQAPDRGYGQYVTPQDQADYLVGAFEWAHQHWPWVTGMFVWNLNYSTITQPDDEKYPWAVLNSDWSPRPAYDALRDMPRP